MCWSKFSFIKLDECYGILHFLSTSSMLIWGYSEDCFTLCLKQNVPCSKVHMTSFVNQQFEYFNLAFQNGLPNAVGKSGKLNNKGKKHLDSNFGNDWKDVMKIAECIVLIPIIDDALWWCLFGFIVAYRQLHHWHPRPLVRHLGTSPAHYLWVILDSPVSTIVLIT